MLIFWVYLSEFKKLTLISRKPMINTRSVVRAALIVSGVKFGRNNYHWKSPYLDLDIFNVYLTVRKCKISVSANIWQYQWQNNLIACFANPSEEKISSTLKFLRHSASSEIHENITNPAQCLNTVRARVYFVWRWKGFENLYWLFSGVFRMARNLKIVHN
jgi:hypothetical protein